MKHSIRLHIAKNVNPHAMFENSACWELGPISESGPIEGYPIVVTI